MMKTRGMTFIEMLVWISVFLAAMWAIVGSILSFYRANTYTLEQAQAVSEARRSVEKVTAAIREANYSNEGAYPVISIGPDSFAFYTDTDTDPVVEKVRYFVEGTEFKRGLVDPAGDPPNYTVPETVDTVAYFVRNLSQSVTTFHYFDLAGAEITDMNDVSDMRFVRIDTVINISPDKLPNELLLRASATLRNLR